MITRPDGETFRLFPHVEIPSIPLFKTPGSIVVNAGGWDMASHDANARLIAAAPELLEALKECQSILSDIYNGKDVFGKVLDSIDTARAAITKATELP
jgi:hypothetical protein